MTNRVLPLDSPRWAELQHAYGSAADLPSRLRQLADLPDAQGESEPWFHLWSALAHQGDVYPASFAAVPHVIAALQSAPLRAGATYFQFPAWVEICRNERKVTIPPDLVSDYFEALSRLPALAAAAAGRAWDHDFLRCALSAIAAAKGHPAMADAIGEVDSEVLLEFREWLEER